MSSTRNARRFLLLAAASVWLLPLSARASTVLLLASDDASDVGAAQSALVATGLFVEAELTVSAGPSSPSLAELSVHDAVLVWAEAPWDDVDGLGEVLADYVDAGGEVVLAAQALQDGFAPGGRFASTPYSPFLSAPSSPVSGDVDLGSPSTDSGHPILAGLTDVGFPDVGQGAPALSAVGQLVAVDSAGNAVVASTCTRDVIGVNLHPPDLALGLPAVTPDAALLLAQALLTTQLDELPVADAGGPYAVDEGGATSLDGSASSPGDLGPIAYAWDLDDDAAFDDSVSETPPFDAALLSGPASLPVALLVTDSCGRTSSSSASVGVLNLAPSIDAVAGGGPGLEGSALSFSVTASDPGGDTLTVSWDFGDGSPGASGASVSHAYADDGTYSAVVTVDDGEGGVTSEATPVVVSNVAPTIDALVGDGAGGLAELLDFAGAASDPAGAQDTLTWSWSWSDGSPVESGVDLDAASHAWSVAGSFAVDLVVADEDGGSTSAQLLVLIEDPGPSLSSVSVLSVGIEGQPIAFSVDAEDSQGDPVLVSWDWGDGSPPDSGLDLTLAEHSYGDDGSYTVTVTATDALGGSAVLTLSALVENEEPVFVVTPSEVATEGTPYTVMLDASDVVADLPDLSYSVAVQPAGALFHSAVRSIVWVPTLADTLSGPHAFEASVDDGDGGSDSLAWSVSVDWVDGDGDGMADSWENQQGLDSGLDDSGLDPDGDGLTNLQEWLGGTEAQGFDGPGEPVQLEPLAGESVGTATPSLSAENAIDPGGDPLTYDFEVYADENLTVLLAEVADLPEGAGGVTAWTVDTALAENSLAYWRVRAGDSLAEGPWTKAEPFFVDELAEPPSVPVPLSPVDTSIDSLVPVLVVAAVTDPEGQDLTVEVELQDDAGQPLEFLAAEEQADGTWRAAGTLALQEDLSYRWRATATDEGGASSLPSDFVSFVVDVTNSQPSAPSPLAPEDGSEIDTQLPVLRVAAGLDPENGPVLVRFTVDSQPDFQSPDRQDLGSVAPGADGAASVDVLLPLGENTEAWARARTEDDRGAVSAWVLWSFHVDALPEPPSAVRVLAPGSGELVDGASLVVRWAFASDPDGDPLSYEIELRSADEPVLWEAVIAESAAGELEGSATVDTELGPGTWSVRVRAIDPGGLIGPWGPASVFGVLPQQGSPLSLEPGEGCGCGTRRAAGAAPLGLLICLVAGWGRLRRSRSLDESLLLPLRSSSSG